MPSLTAPEPSSNSSPPVSTRISERDSFAVYVHWPFCQAKCPYCDFNSHVRQGGIDEARFTDAYLKELEHMRGLTGPRNVESIFFGGGTPSLMSASTVGAILDCIAGHWDVSTDTEISLEANPTSVEAERFAGYRSAGVNRVSLGVQSLRDDALKALGRLHSADEARAALGLARKTFDRVSFDMIYARPGQSVEAWRDELQEALNLGPDHLSLYQLTIEPDTMFAVLHMAGKLRTPDDEQARALFEATQSICEAAGLPAYEISNHARPGEECRHNLVYWRMGDYAGVGPGAHGRLRVEDARQASVTHKLPEEWLSSVESKGHGLAAFEALSQDDEAQEILLMGLRLSEGLDLARYTNAGGVLREEKLGWLLQDGLVERDATRLRVTPQGKLLLNAVIAELSG